jgi:nucleotide-binding universal stress UspA family protein
MVDGSVAFVVGLAGQQDGWMAFEIGTDGIGGLVVGFDGSGPSQDALAFSAGIARRNRAALTVVFVIDPTADALAAIAPGAAGAIEASAAAASAHVEAQARAALEDLALTWEFVCTRGEPAAVLEMIAADRRADAIVVGRSRSRMHRRLGSLPARLMRTAERPIAVVP